MSKKYSYLIESKERILDGVLSPYIYKIRDLPDEEKPREKLSKRGVDSLTTPELLAVILNTGTIKEELSVMCHRIIKDYGEKGLLSMKDPKQLSEVLDVPFGKALQIIACGELGRRFFERNNMATPIIRSADDVFEYVKDMRCLPKEHLRGLYLNTHYKLIHDEIISIGTVDANLIHPREVFKPALEYSAAALILVHNHPSGDPEPSKNDIEVTKQISSAGELLGIPLTDHIIVTAKNYKHIIFK